MMNGKRGTLSIPHSSFRVHHFNHGSSLPFLPFFLGCSTSRGRVAAGGGAVVVSVFFGEVVAGGGAVVMTGGGSSILGAGGSVTCSIFGVVMVSVASPAAVFLP